MLDTRIFSVQTEIDIRNTMKAYREKMHFDTLCELLKLGMISEKEFVRRTQHIITYNPERPLKEEES